MNTAVADQTATPKMAIAYPRLMDGLWTDGAGCDNGVLRIGNSPILPQRRSVGWHALGAAQAHPRIRPRRMRGVAEVNCGVFLGRGVRPTAQPVVHDGCRPLWIMIRAGCVISEIEGVRHPFRSVADHIQHTIRTGAVRIAAHRNHTAEAAFEGIRLLFIPAAAPGINSFASAARS